MNTLYCTGIVVTSVFTIGYVMTDSHVFNAKRNREKWLMVNVYDLKVQKELLQLNEWRKMPILKKLQEFPNLPSESIKD